MIEILNGRYSIHDYVYTAWCSLPDSGRGVYDEEIDLIVRNTDRLHRRPGVTALKRAAQAELDKRYERGMTVRKVTRVW